MKMQAVAALILLNLLLWAVFLIKFKKLFTTEKIMLEFRAGMERLSSDLQRNTVSSVNLIEEKIRALKEASAEAERKIAIAERRLDTLKNERALFEQGAFLQSQISGRSADIPEKARSKKKPAAKAAVERYRKSAPLKETPVPGADAVYALTGLFKENAQKSLFEDAGQTVTVTSDGDSYGKIPLVKPEIVFSENQIVPKKDFLSQVRDLNALGKNVEEIAAETGRSTTEVDLVLAMLA